MTSAAAPVARCGYRALLDGLAGGGDGWRIAVGEDWRQGRAVYGGLTAALCVETALRAMDTLPPLKSLHVALMGAASSELTLQPTLLRRGKSTAFVGVDVGGEGGMTARALLTFAGARPSGIAHDLATPPCVAAPEMCADFFEDRPCPAFSRHFDMRRAGGDLPFSGSARPDLAIWIRHRGADALCTGVAALIVMADASPPAAITTFTAPAPISTVTWSFDILRKLDGTEAAGWVLLTSQSVSASCGYSAQVMQMWRPDGVRLMTGMQCVALFA